LMTFAEFERLPESSVEFSPGVAQAN